MHEISAAFARNLKAKVLTRLDHEKLVENMGNGENRLDQAQNLSTFHLIILGHGRQSLPSIKGG